MNKTEVKKFPEGWTWVKMGDVCNLVNGNAHKPSDWSNIGIPIIRIQNLNDKTKPFNYWAGSLSDKVMVNKGDILLAWSGTPGTSFGAHIWTGDTGVLNQHIFRVDFYNGLIDPNWVVYAINEQLDILIQKAHGGVGLRHVNKKTVESLKIILPPLPEQKRIAAILNEQISAVEKARVAAEARLEAAKALPAAYLREVFESEVAKKWQLKPLHEIATLLPSKSIASDGDTEVRAITTACLSENGFLPSGVKSARMWRNDVANCVISSGEVLIARSNTPELVGRVAMFTGEPVGIVASDLTIRIWPNNFMMPEFLTAYLSSLYITGYWKGRAGGASGSMKKITRGQIISEKIPCPPPSEQKRNVIKIGDHMKTITKLIKFAEQEVESIKSLPSAMLRRAFNGEL